MKLSDFKGNLSPMTTRNYITSRVYIVVIICILFTGKYLVFFFYPLDL